mgnify:CR=1 FL=1
MNPEVKRLCLISLRGGKYKQGQNKLRMDDKYCCLGVLCELAFTQGVVKRRKYGGTFLYGKKGEKVILPPEVADWADVEINPTVVLDANEVVKLTELNDEWNYNFDEIADILAELNEQLGSCLPEKEQNLWTGLSCEFNEWWTSIKFQDIIKDFY